MAKTPKAVPGDEERGGSTPPPNPLRSPLSDRSPDPQRPPRLASSVAPGAVRTGRHVLLRRPTPQDCSAFLGMVAESRALYDRWLHPPADVETFNRYVALGRTPERDHLLVCDRVSGAIAGVINISNIIHGLFQNATLGYYGNVRFAGRGVMTEGLGLVLDHAFRGLRLHRLEANIQPENEASKRLVLRLGFRREGFSPKMLRIDGIWRDHERYAMLCEEWEVMRRQHLPECTEPEG